MNGSHRHSIFRKQTGQLIANVLSGELKVQLQTKATKLITSTQNLLATPQARNLFMVAVVILVFSIPTFGFQAKDLKDVITGFKDFLYNDVRFAICVIGFAFGGFGLIFSKNPDTRKQAVFVILGAAFFAFAPGILKFIADKTGTANPQ